MSGMNLYYQTINQAVKLSSFLKPWDLATENWRIKNRKHCMNYSFFFQSKSLIISKGEPGVQRKQKATQQEKNE